MEPVSIITGGVSLARTAMEALSAIRGMVGADVVSALFNWEGTKMEGSDVIRVKRQLEGSGKRWWYYVKPVPEYTFVRFPVIESCLEELSGTVKGEPNADARYWRWIPTVQRGVRGSMDPANIKVDFIVVGYKPKALLKYFSTK